MARLQDKIALVTGATTGIGFAIARRFLAEGARVAITGSNGGRLEDAKASLGADTVAIRADAGDTASQRDVARAVAAAFGKLDICVVNAGVAEFRPVEAWDEAGFDRSVAVNLKGPFFLVQALLPILADPSSIVFTGSVNAHLGMANSGVYAATKAGLVSLARTMSGELIGRGIRANVISPGPIETPLYGKLGLGAADLAGMKHSLLGQVPAGRFGEPDEIAAAAVYFASDESRYTIGSELIVDGGMLIM